MTKVNKILWRMYWPLSYMKRCYPKASKKRRIMNKWINRFGNDVDLSHIIHSPNPFLKLLEHCEFKGKYIPVPTESGSIDES